MAGNVVRFPRDRVVRVPPRPVRDRRPAGMRVVG